MTTTMDSHPTIFDRLRGTPKALRKKFKAHEKSPSFESKSGKTNKEMHANKKVNKNDACCFHCRYLGRRTIYTLKPEDCYDYALKLEEGVSEKLALKVNMKMETKMMQLEYMLPSPQVSKQRRKGVKKGTERPSSEVIPSPVAVFDDFNSSPTSSDEASIHSFHDVNSNPRLSSSPSNRHFFNVLDGNRGRSNTFNGQFDYNGVTDPDFPAPESILLHEIAYCVTVPEKPRLFLLTSRGREGGLTCRVFLFSSREKAQLLKLCLARQFEIAYTEWQSRLLRRASRRRSSLFDRQTSQSSLSSTGSRSNQYSSNTSLNDPVPESTQFHSCHVDCGMGHGSSSEEEDAFEDPHMHKEFKRRASCLANPEQLLVVGDEEVANMKKRFNDVLSRKGASSGSVPTSDEDNSL